MVKRKDLNQAERIFNTGAIPASSGGISGAIMSNIGSGITLAKDIQKDGLQWSDLAKYAWNSSLDQLYNYPGMGIRGY